MFMNAKMTWPTRLKMWSCYKIQVSRPRIQKSQSKSLQVNIQAKRPRSNQLAKIHLKDLFRNWSKREYPKILVTLVAKVAKLVSSKWT